MDDTNTDKFFLFTTCELRMDDNKIFFSNSCVFWLYVVFFTPKLFIDGRQLFCLLFFFLCLLSSTSISYLFFCLSFSSIFNLFSICFCLVLKSENYEVFYDSTIDYSFSLLYSTVAYISFVLSCGILW